MQDASNTKNPNEAKVNLSDHSSVKNFLDDSVSEVALIFSSFIFLHSCNFSFAPIPERIRSTYACMIM